MSIENKAIAYGEPRYGCSCANCVYREISPARGSICVLCDLPTKLDKCCEQWCWDIVQPVEEENQGELF